MMRYAMDRPGVIRAKTVGMEGHASTGAAGNSTRNVEPFPTSLSTVSVPPWLVTVWRQIDRPSPVPLSSPTCRVVKNGSKIRLAYHRVDTHGGRRTIAPGVPHPCRVHSAKSPRQAWPRGLPERCRRRTLIRGGVTMKIRTGGIALLAALAVGGMGCGSGGAVEEEPPPPSTYTLSGFVNATSGPAVSGVTITLAGASSGTAVTNAGGYYSFSSLANGSYTVTPSLAGYTFSRSATRSS